MADLNDSIASAQTAVTVVRRNYDTVQRLAEKQAATKLQVQDAKDAVDRAALHLNALIDQKATLVTSSDRTVAEAKVRDAESAVMLARHTIAAGDRGLAYSRTLYQFDLKVGAYLDQATWRAWLASWTKSK